jgi:uncharacterized membrane protein
MTSIESGDQARDLVARTGAPAMRRARRRDDIEILGLVLGILLVLLVLALTLGVGPAFTG